MSELKNDSRLGDTASRTGKLDIDNDTRKVKKFLRPMTRDEVKGLFDELGLSDKTLRNRYADSVEAYTDDLARSWILEKDGVLTSEDYSGGATWENLTKALVELGHKGIAAKVNEPELHISCFTESVIERSVKDTKILSSVNLQGETIKLSVAESYSTVSSPMTTEQNNMMRDEEIEIAESRITQLQKKYIDISVKAANEMSENVSVKNLRYSFISLPQKLKKEHRKFIKEAKADLKQAESADEIFDVIGEHFDYLRYSLLKYVIDLYGSDELKKEMADYVMKMEAFRKETRVEIFSEVCDDEPEKLNGNFASMVTKHDIDWATATLEDVEKFRIKLCRELSLYDFTLNLVQVARGCVEVTWKVPKSLVAYIQNSVKPNSQTMREYNVITLTIDGFIAYDNITAMQNVHKVIRMEVHAITIHYSYMMDQMIPDTVVPYLVERRLLSPKKATEVTNLHSKTRKTSAILKTLDERNVIGRLSTFCAALINAEQPHIADRLTNKFRHLMKGEVVSTVDDYDDDNYMITGEEGALSSLPYLNRCLITAQIEGTTLTRRQYNSIFSLTCSVFILPTGALQYVGHTLNPLTLYWHNTSHEREDEMQYSIGLLSEMAHEGIIKITKEDEAEIYIPNIQEMKLMEGACDGDVECVKSVLDAGVSVDITKPDGLSSLLLASHNGHVDVIDILLQHGARVDLQQEDGWSSLMSASQNGHLKTVDKLLQHGASVDLQKKDGWTSLMSASVNGHVRVVERLLQHGARIDAQEQDGVTSLMVASHGGHTDVVETLLQNRASIDLQEKNGLSSMMVASQCGHVDVVEKLLQYGARVNLQDKRNVTSLMLAVYNGSSEVVDVLLKNKADVNIAELDNDTALILACQRNELETVSSLLKFGANPTVCNMEGQAPLLLAVRNNNIAIVRELIAARVDVNCVHEGGLSALMLCCEKGNSEIADLLLDSHANPNLQQSSTGFTAVMFACKNGHLDTVMTLMRHDANPHIKNREGMTALDLASINEFQDVYAVLQLMDPPPIEYTHDDENDFEHPDDVIVQETVEILMERFHAQMSAAPKLSFYNSDKAVDLRVSREKFNKYSRMSITCIGDDSNT